MASPKIAAIMKFTQKGYTIRAGSSFLNDGVRPGTKVKERQVLLPEFDICTTM